MIGTSMVMSNQILAQISSNDHQTLPGVMGHIPPQAFSFRIPRVATGDISGLLEMKGSKLNKWSKIGAEGLATPKIIPRCVTGSRGNHPESPKIVKFRSAKIYVNFWI